MRTLFILALLCTPCFAQKPPKTAGMPKPPQAEPQQDFGLLQRGGSYQPRPLTDAEYKLQKKRYAEWMVHQKAAARAGISGKGGKRRRTDGISVHDSYQNAAMEAVRQVQGR